MPRGRKPDPIKKMLLPLAVEFVEKISSSINDYVNKRVAEEFQAAADKARGSGGTVGPGRRSAAKRAGGRKKVEPCRAPGCTNPSKGPRYKFFCEEHRQSLSDEEKAKITAAHKAAAKAGGAAEAGVGGSEQPASADEKAAQTKKAKAAGAKKKAKKKGK